ncbi:RNA polymerase sigma factor [Dyadobacter fermentans]|uniref:RNA polymerase, sigma-24 subunit, ECF subfamily n=1 Tax=Dyadobacter fermentans (strain ATCC 700827 / DSM 18053 / CIP 107007 / KCTC 52180 / NS114) TaxID=471854 RepID=C6VRK5_DYAFD|nr:sigma-70 family RNA polymerase sigma factor [Dyadobacter fermentans]ACT92708.1 RNA polymerase, sigma-24 subunit, ECF subfamily [Dyadobacter fermentans DSM 18053]
MASTFTDNDDKVLWQRFRQGDEEAFTALYQRYVRVLYSYGKKLATEDAVIEDLVQDLFIDLWQSRSRLADAESPRFYLFRSLRRRIHKAGNGRFNERWEYIDEGFHPVELSKESEIIESEQFQKQKDELDAWLKSLPGRQYEVLMLRYYQDFSYSQISEMLTINEQSVRNLVQRAVSKLRQLTISAAISGLFIFLLK